MERIFEQAKDLHVVAIKVYAKSGDAYAYADAKYQVKFTADELHDAFLKGLVVVDAVGVEYWPISCKVASGVTTVTYATTDSSAATTAKLATVKSA